MTYLAGRLALFALTLLLISVLTFAVTNILPGDVAIMIMGTRGNPTSIAALQEQLGLNDPLIVQYGRWIGGMLTGDWGVSLRSRSRSRTFLARSSRRARMIVVMSMTIALALAIPLGVWSAVHRDRWQDTLGSSMALAGISLPDFFWGIVLILLFARWLGWLPSSGFAVADRGLLARRAPRPAALDRARPEPDGASHADDALDHDRGHEPGLHPRLPRQGAERGCGDLPPRAAQRDRRRW